MPLEMLKISDESVIVNGIYSISEAAMYAKISSRMLRRWLRGTKTSNSVIKQKSLIEDGEYINFLDFIQTLAVREIRIQYDIPLSKIREAVDFLTIEKNIAYPLAREHEIFTDGKGIFIFVNDREDLIKITSPNKEQYNLKQIVQVYLSEIDFNDEGYANSFHPHPGVLMDPQIRFGEPIVKECGIRAVTLYDAVLSEGNITNAAKAFGVSEDNVQTAYSYIDSLQRVA